MLKHNAYQNCKNYLHLRYICTAQRLPTVDYYFLKIPKYSSCYNCNLLIIGRVLGCPLSPQIYLRYEIYPLEILQVKDPFNGWCSVWVAKILGIGDRPDVEEAGQPTHNDSFPISTERESTEFLKKLTHGWKIQVHVC